MVSAKTVTSSSTGTVAASTVISGNAHGGSAPVSGAHVYLLAVGTTGYGGASTSVLDGSVTGHSDATGGYVVTDSVGGFTVPDTAITCTSSQLTYLLVTGGDAGGGVNSSASLIAALGVCPSSASTTTVWVNEVTTVGTAFALAGYATDPTHISSSGSALATQGLKNAFSLAANLYNQSLGQALTTTPAGNGAVPQQTINTLANILAACVNTAGSSSSACQSLFGATSTTKPVSDTASAAIAIAHNPSGNVATLFALQSMSGSEFQPALSVSPTSLILPIIYTGGGLSDPLGLAVDSKGNVWVGNGGNGARNSFSPTGVPLSQTGFLDGLTGSELTVAIDSQNDAWALDSSANGISELSAEGDVLGAVAQFANTSLKFPLGMAFDRNSMMWVGDDNGLTEVYPNGQVAQKIAIPSAQGEGVGDVEIDGLGNVWATNFDTNALIKLSSSGVPAFGVAGVGGGGLKSPEGIAIDSQNNIWIANANGSNISKFSNSGSPLSPTGFFGGGISANRFLAVDGAGYIWTPSSNSGIISQFDNSGNPRPTARWCSWSARQLRWSLPSRPLRPTTCWVRGPSSSEHLPRHKLKELHMA